MLIMKAEEFTQRENINKDICWLWKDQIKIGSLVV